MLAWGFADCAVHGAIASTPRVVAHAGVLDASVALTEILDPGGRMRTLGYDP